MHRFPGFPPADRLSSRIARVTEGHESLALPRREECLVNPWLLSPLPWEVRVSHRQCFEGVATHKWGLNSVESQKGLDSLSIRTVTVRASLAISSSSAAEMVELVLLQSRSPRVSIREKTRPSGLRPSALGPSCVCWTLGHFRPASGLHASLYYFGWKATFA